MIGKRFRVVIMAAVLLTALSVRSAELSPWDEWRMGYTNFEIGEQKRSRGDYTAALAAFEKSRTHYQAVKRARPDWNQKVIRERLTACDKQIADLRRLLGDKAPSAAETRPRDKRASRTGRSGVDGTPPRGGDDAAQLRKLRAELAEAKSELEELRSERARRGNYETEIANLLRDRRIANEKYALLEKRCQKLQDELKKPESALHELRRQLVEKNERLVDAEKSIRLMEERLRRMERGNSDSNRDKNLLRSQLRQSESERQRLQHEFETLRTSLEAERARIANVNARLADANSRIAELEKALRDAEKDLNSARSNVKTAAGVSNEELTRLRNIASAAEKRSAQFQKQCVDLRRECDELLKQLNGMEQLRVKYESDIAALRSESDKQHTRADSLADELANVRELQRRQEAELKRTLAEIEPLRKRLAQRDSEDFKGMVEARDAVRKLEAEITALKTRDAEIVVELSEERKTAAALRRELDIVRGEVRKAKGAQKSAEQELESVRGDAERFHTLLPKYQELERNFAALRKENQENRVKLAAASPREAELRRIKLRLVELDQLKISLGREQRLNSELLAEKKKLQNELKGLRDKSAQLAAAQKKLETMKALQREVEELRRVNQDAVARLEKAKNLESELVAAKRALIEGGAAQLELHEVKQAYAKTLEERNAAASEAALLRDKLAAAEAAAARSARAAEEYKLGAEQELENTRRELRAAQEEAKRSARTASDDKSGMAQELEETRRKLRSAQKEAKKSAPSASENGKVMAQELEKTRQKLRAAQEEATKAARAASDARIGMEQKLEKIRQQLRAAQEKATQLEALIPQVEQLRKLNDDLMYARSFEAELVKARTQLGELARFKEELAGVIRLNEQLIKEKTALEKELARRPDIPVSEDEPEKIPAALSKEKPEDYVTEGMLAESDGNSELAIWNYRKALEADRNHAAAAERLGMLLLRRQEFSEASHMLAMARSASPARLDLALAVSRAYLGQKRFGNAQAVVEPLLRDHPENGELLTVAAMAAAEGGEVPKAEKYLKLAIRYLPKSPEPLIEYSRLLVRHDSARMEEAARLYESARIMGAPPDIELEPALGPRLDKRRELEQFLTSAMNEAFNNHDYYSASWYCRQLLDINRRPQYFTPLLALAKLLGGESGSARETLTFNAESAQGSLVLALVELKEGNRTAFAAAVRRALALNKGKPVTIDAEWRNLGFALDAAGVADSAAGKELSRAYKWEVAR